MYRTIFFIIAALVAVPAWSSLEASGLVDEPVIDTAPLNDFATDDPPRHGWTTLVRNDGGIAVTVDTRHLAPATPHTFWIVVFNNPDGCSDPCGADDLIPDGLADPASIFGGAVVTDANGKMFVSSGVTKDRAASEQRCCFGSLTEPFGAEIHVVVREHPTATNEDVHTHLQTPTGGTNVQGSTHLPPS